jgi:hypothetical protein
MYHVCFDVMEAEEDGKKRVYYYVSVLAGSEEVLNRPVDIVLIEGRPPVLRQAGTMCTTALAFFAAEMSREELKWWMDSDCWGKYLPEDEGKKYRVLYIWEAELACNCGGY